METRITHIPFLGTDPETIKQQFALAPERVPGATRFEYTAPHYVELIIDGEDLSYWTHPEITAYRE